MGYLHTGNFISFKIENPKQCLDIFGKYFHTFVIPYKLFTNPKLY